MERVVSILQRVELGIAIAGGLVILWGVVTSLVEFVLLEHKRFHGRTICVPRENLRHHLGSYLLLGLEILIAADVLRTIHNPTQQELIVLGSIVAIRSVLDFFLTRSIKNHNCSSDSNA